MNSILHDNQNMSYGKSFDGNNTSSLKISSSLINEEGAVLFSSFGQLKNNSFRNSQSGTESNRNSMIIQTQQNDDNLGPVDNYWDNGDDGDDGDYGDNGFTLADSLSPGLNQNSNQNKTPEKNKSFNTSLPQFNLQLQYANHHPSTQTNLSTVLPLPFASAPSAAIPAPIPAVVRNPLALLDPHDPSESKNSKEVKKDKRTYRNPVTKQNQLKVNTGSSGLTRKQMMLKSLNTKKKVDETSVRPTSSVDIISMITRCSLNSSPARFNHGNNHHGFSLHSKFNSTTPVSNSLAAYLQQRKKSTQNNGSNGERKDTGLISNFGHPQNSENIDNNNNNNNINNMNGRNEMKNSNTDQHLISNSDDYFGGNYDNYDDGNNDDDDGDMDGGFSGGGFDDNYDINDNNNNNNNNYNYNYNSNNNNNNNNDNGDGGEETNEALLLLQEEKLLSERVENVLNDAGFHNTLEDDYSIIYGRDSQQFETFESLCKKHIQNFIIGTEKYSKETNLSKRVVDWTNKMEPILKEQENRPFFDIHKYSDETLESIHNQIQQKEIKNIKNKKKEQDKNNNNNKENVVSFSSLVNGKESYEVGRIFLSCLQLANLGNIDFNQTKENISDFEVNLLNEKSNRLQIENYRAPSVLI